MIVNAAHAIADISADRPGGKGKILIATQRDEESVVVSISDDGQGIKPEKRDKILEPFLRLKKSARARGRGWPYHIPSSRNIVAPFE